MSLGYLYTTIMLFVLIQIFLCNQKMNRRNLKKCRFQMVAANFLIEYSGQLLSISPEIVYSNLIK